MPKYRCPCGADGFTNPYDIQRHALEVHGRNVEPIEYKAVSQELAAKTGRQNASKSFKCGGGPRTMQPMDTKGD